MRKPPSSKRATLQDVARVAGVGPMTVSRTINGHPYVSEETAKKVRAAIRKLDYRPNHAARMLTGQLSRSIGLIVPDLADPFFSVVSHAVQETARQNEYLVWLAASDGDPAIEAAQMRQMTNHPVDGVLLVPVESKAEYLKAVVAGPTPIITIDRPLEVATTDSIEVENFRGARIAVEHLISHRHRKITCIATNSHLRTIKDRIAGFRECMRQAKLPNANVLRLLDQSNAKPALIKLFNSSDRPEAIFSANNASTIWIIGALREMEIKLGTDVALVAFDDVDFYELITPPVTAVRQPAAELGHVAVRMLLQRIRNEFEAPSVRTVLPVTMVVRESCGCGKQVFVPRP